MVAQVLVTGGLGFIGSAFIRQLTTAGEHVVNVDADTYAGDERRLHGVERMCETIPMDIAGAALHDLIARHRPEIIVHFAAESHVTRSENASDLFFQTNVEGTRQILEAAEKLETSLVIHVSTDEVYGPCLAEPFGEDEKEPGEGRATSAYARSKAVADDLARSFADRVPVIVVRPTNCFGPWQHPEKAIARWTTRALNGLGLPVWGDGGHVRDWMFVDDASDGIMTLMQRGTPGETYNLAPEGSPRTNLDMALAIARAAGRRDEDVYLTEYDRPDHDRRYAVDASKIRALGWTATAEIERHLGETVDWYAANRDWWATLVDDAESLYDDAQKRVTT